MSAFMLTNLSNVVANGAKTSMGFKKNHLNACARAVNEKFNTTRTAEQIKNHLKTWQKRFAKISRLRKLSAAGWNNEVFMITLDEEHYNSYIQDHKGDAEFFNKPLLYFGEMQTIFGNSMATGNFAKDSSVALGTADVHAEEGNAGETERPISPNEQGTSSHPSKNKKAKIVEDDEGLIGALNKIGDKLAIAMTQVAKSDSALPEDLFESVSSLPGFTELQISMYYAHLVANPLMAKAFYNLPFNHKLNWLAMFVSEKFPGQ